jgi:hypothetical protein
MDGISGRPGVGSSGTQPPSTGTAYSGNYIAGLVFHVTSGGLWFQGYRWWVAASGQDTAPLKFALWQIYGTASGVNTHGSLVPGSVVTSATLSAGWNYTALPAPLALSAYIPYVAAAGGVFSTGFPDTPNQFFASDPYSSGITNGPLSAYASQAATADFMPQMPFTVASSDPSAAMPTTNNLDDNLWVDVQVTDAAPAAVSYRVFPSMVRPWPNITTATDQTGYTLGLQFSLTQVCTLSKIWHYSPDATDGGAATVLPTRCAIWDVGSQTVVSGTDNTSPSWKNPDGTAASAANGWVYCDYSGSGVTLAASNSYKVSTFHAAGANWFGAAANVWGTGNLYANGMTQGPIVVPGDSGASPGQQSWNTVTWAYPATSTNPETDSIDVEVIPVPPAPPAAPVLYSMRMMP